MKAKEPAVVLGFNIHGLAVARALAKSGVEVHALSQSRDLPSIHTRFAKVHVCESVNSEGLIDALQEFAAAELNGRKAVLFPTSDRMVRVLGQRWPELEANYRLSWAACREIVLTLLQKNELPELCERQEVRHPRSVPLHDKRDCKSVSDELSFPIIIKPSRSQAGFKAIKIGSSVELEEAVARHRDDLPFVAQQWVEGPNDALFFCTLFLRDGREEAVFTGRKLRAEPAGTGQGTIMTSEPNSEIVAIARKFVRELGLSGPVAIEFKRDSEGRYWLIEPNVGRTEYCIDLLIQAGINLPWIEYCFAVGEPTPLPHTHVENEVTWYDTDKDPFCFLRRLLADPRSTLGRKRSVFPFFGHDDPGPLAASLRLNGKALSRLLFRPWLRSSSAAKSPRTAT